MIRDDLKKETAVTWRAGSLLDDDPHFRGDVSGYIYNSTESRSITSPADRIVPERRDTRRGRQSLVNNTSYVSRSKRDKWRELSAVKRVMAGSSYRVARCMHMHSHKGVDVIREGDKAYYGGVDTCGSVWTCPVCGRRISQARREELRSGLAGSGLIPLMVTITLQHNLSDPLDDLLDALTDSLRRLKSGRWWQDFKRRYDVKAHVASLEIRWSPSTGWHPHRHMLILTDMDLSGISTEAVKRELTERYRQLLSDNHGRYASEFHSIDVRVGDQYVGDYISKFGLPDELTMAHAKQSSSDSYHPIELALMADQGDGQAYKLWMDYCRSTLGKRQMTWSHHGRQALGLGQEVADEVLASEVEPDREVIASITDYKLWSYIIEGGLSGRILDMARAGDVRGVAVYLQELSECARGSPDIHGEYQGVDIS